LVLFLKNVESLEVYRKTEKGTTLEWSLQASQRDPREETNLINISMCDGNAKKSERWMITSCDVPSNKLPAMKKTPIVEVAANLDKAVNGTVYHGLPLKIKSGYPVHINGGFQLHSSRTSIDTSLQVNEVFLKYCMTAAYVKMLIALSREKLSDRYVHWPVSRNTDIFWKTGVQMVMCKISTNNKLVV
jgi:hypothetical protein